MSLRLSLILSIDTTGTIGYGNGSEPYIREDRVHFKNITTYTPFFSQNLLIVGRKTFETLPDAMKKCSHRTYAVLTSDVSKYSHPNAKFFNKFDDVMGYCLSKNNFYKYFVIGGATMYNLATETEFVVEIFLTKLDTDITKLLSCETIRIKDFDYAKNFDMCGSHQIKSDIKLNDLVTIPNATVEFFHYKKRYEPFELQYINLMKRIISKGYTKTGRNGVVLSLPDQTIKIDLNAGFPILTIRKAFFRGIVEELLWMMRGQTDVKVLREKNIHIWDGNSNLEYLKKVGLDSTLGEYDIGPGYGFQMRHCGEPYINAQTSYASKGHDQLQQCINLIKTDPNSRRIIIDLWTVPQLKQMALMPCHLLYQFTVNQNRLSCHFYQRSWDVNLGWNTSTAALLTHLVAHFTDLNVGTLTHTICDAHLYSVHLDKIKSFIDVIPQKLPTLKIIGSKPSDIGSYDSSNITLEDYKSGPIVKGMQMIS